MARHVLAHVPATAQKAHSAKRMTPAEAGTLVNWLSTRVEALSGGGHLVVAPSDCHADERALVASRLARAHELGLVVVPGAYVERLKSGGSGDENVLTAQVAPVHLIHCSACDLSYWTTHLHCCRCGQVFKSSSAYERHAVGAGGRCATAEQLRRRHLRLGADGVWRREPPRTLAG